ncbi:MAG TPA: 6-phospho-3-hexuloisomerase [Candidatus Thermoplasmatota archaeon]|nr:6-phospho-3-hexuloisomerase [Candidatus Thermoplasmatota archaeon]
MRGSSRGTGARARPSSPAFEAIAHNQQRIAEILAGVDARAVSDLVARLAAARKIILFGRGRSGLVGRGFAMRLYHLGKNAFYVGETVTPPVDRETLVVVLSGSGETFAVALTAQLAKESGASVVALTARRQSRVARHADLIVEIPVPARNPRPDLAPLGTLFEQAAMQLVDGVVAELASRLGQNEADMRKRHATLE